MVTLPELLILGERFPRGSATFGFLISGNKAFGSRIGQKKQFPSIATRALCQKHGCTLDSDSFDRGVLSRRSALPSPSTRRSKSRFHRARAPCRCRIEYRESSRFCYSLSRQSLAPRHANGVTGTSLFLSVSGNFFVAISLDRMYRPCHRRISCVLASSILSIQKRIRLRPARRT
jgi:hypothetical protein